MSLIISLISGTVLKNLPIDSSDFNKPVKSNFISLSLGKYKVNSVGNAFVE